MATCSTHYVKCETGIQLFSRLAKHPSVSNLDVNLLQELHPEDVIEIFGEAGTGKTEFLYHFIARCILPHSWKSLKLEGLGAGVLFIDTDCHFNLLRLITILEKRVMIARKNCLDANDDVLEGKIPFIKNCLKFLNIVKCSNSEHLMTTLHSLENVLASDTNISVLIIDSISAFYWLDRMNQMDQLKKLEEYYGNMVSVLNKLLCSYKLVLIATKQFLMKTSDANWLLSKGMKDYKATVTSSLNSEFDFMGKYWQKFVTHRLVLQKHQVNESGRTVGTIYKCSKGSREIKQYEISDCGVQVYL